MADKFEISLRLSHPIRELSEMLSKMGLGASVFHVMGENHRQIGGRTIASPPNLTNYCSVSLYEGPGEDLQEILKRIVRRLDSSRVHLSEHVGSGGKAAIAIGWFCDGNSGAEFKTLLLSKLVTLGLDLDFYIYP